MVMTEDGKDLEEAEAKLMARESMHCPAKIWVQEMEVVKQEGQHRAGMREERCKGRIGEAAI